MHRAAGKVIQLLLCVSVCVRTAIGYKSVQDTHVLAKLDLKTRAAKLVLNICENVNRSLSVVVVRMRSGGILKQK